MNKVIIINLNGNAFQLEEDGYDALRAYLDNARGRLDGNPDRDEIIADIEQAIADKFRQLLGSSKNVVLGSEVSTVVREMGPVDGSPGGGPAAGAAAGAPAPEPASAAGSSKRLYKIHDGAMLFGVCNGIAAYSGIDVTLVRLAFVLVSVFYGVGILAYVALAILLPHPVTPADKAAAFGPPPTAQDFIRRARAGYYEGMRTFGDREAHREWRRRFRQEMRDWKREFKDQARGWRFNWHWRYAPPSPPTPGSLLLYPILTVVSLMLTLALVYGIIQLLSVGLLFGFALPASVPVWFAIILLFVAYNFIKWPIRVMRHSAYLGAHPSYGHPIALFWNAIFGLFALVFMLWLLSHHSADLGHALRHLPDTVHEAVHTFKEWWDKQ